MSASSSRNFPGPAQTPFIQHPHPLAKRQYLGPDDASSGASFARQIADQAEIGAYLFLTTDSSSVSSPALPFPSEEAMTQCQVFSGNAVVSCYPTTDTVVRQNEWATFVCTSPFTPSFLARISSVYTFLLQGTAVVRRSLSLTGSTSSFSRQTHLSVFLNGVATSIPQIELASLELKSTIPGGVRMVPDGRAETSRILSTGLSFGPTRR